MAILSGGLIGLNCGSQTRIENSYAQSDVRGDANVGGLVGINLLVAGRVRGDVTTKNAPVVVLRDCYSACLVTGQDNTGGCIGRTDPNALQEGCCFLSLDDGGGPDNGLGTELSDAAMRQQASFVGWDFETIWMICERMDYPQLRWEGVDCQK